MFRRRNWALLLVSLATFIGQSRAQTITGVISGSVTDPSGGMVPGAKVQLSNEATTESRTAVTDSSGDFIFAAALPGHYTVSVECAGFKRLEKKGYVLTSSERLSTGRLALEVGNTTEAITVSGEGAPVQIESADRSAELSGKQIMNMPSASRSVFWMLKNLPSAVTDQRALTGAYQGATLTPAFNGLNWNMTENTVDGMSANPVMNLNYSGVVVNADAVAEVKVQLNNFDAEYGGNGGAVITLVTRGGGSTFHGGAYDFQRNEEFDANTFFNNKQGLAKPRDRVATPGWNIGGPVYIPGKFNRNKNRLFFYVSQELQRVSLFANNNFTVPTAAERTGDFSQTIDTNGKLIVIKDPQTGAAFPNNVIPASRIDPNGQKLLSIFPQPNFTNRAVSGGSYNYAAFQNYPRQSHNEIFRGDWNPSDKLRMFVSGTLWQFNWVRWQDAGQTWPLLTSNFIEKNPSMHGNIDYMFSPTLVGEFTMGSQWRTLITEANNPPDYAKLSRSALGITLGQFYPANNPNGTMPYALYGGGLPNTANVTLAGDFPIQQTMPMTSATASLTKIAGSHTFKTGAMVEVGQSQVDLYNQFAGQFNFGRDTNNPLDTNFPTSNALLGVYDSYSESSTRPHAHGTEDLMEFYAQDTWKVNRRLTLHYGLRVSLSGVYHQTDGKGVTFLTSAFDAKNAPSLYTYATNPATGAAAAYNPLTGQYLPAVFRGALLPNSGNITNGQVSNGTPAYPSSLLGYSSPAWSPRFGFAYDLTGDGKTALRGGAGVTHQTRWGINDSPMANTVFTPTLYYGTMSALNFSSAQGALFPQSLTALDPNFQCPAVYTFSLGIQRDIGHHTVLDVGWVNTEGRRLPRSRSLNTVPFAAEFQPQNANPVAAGYLPDNYFRPYMGYGSVTWNEYSGSSNYNALQVQANRRFSTLTASGAYTWSRNMDYGTQASNYVSDRWFYGRAAFNHPQVAGLNLMWDIPKASRLANTAFVRTAFDGWQVAMTGTWQIGAPNGGNGNGFGFSSAAGINYTGGGEAGRMIVTGPVQLSRGDRTRNEFFNTSVFAQPLQSTVAQPYLGLGNMARDLFNGPGQNNEDIAFFKTLRLTERFSMTLRWEMFNAFNHPSFYGVDTTARFDAAGNQISQTFGQVNQVLAPRQMQWSVRLAF
jgi:hypothetical protein